MNIGVIGTGYVGLVTGACLADSGNTVYCVDNDKNKVSLLNSGVMPVYEPGLKELVLKNVKNERLIFTGDMDFAVKKTNVIFIAVGTPPQENGEADLSNIFTVTEGIVNSMSGNGYKVVVVKSTVPVGTCKKVENIIRKTTDDFSIVSNPEFLKEGAAIDDFQRPDRIIIGINSDKWSSKAKEVMDEIYEPFVRTGAPVYFMDTNSSELTKYAANAMLALRITFMNELANVCSLAGVNVDNVRIGIGSDKRIGKSFLFPGIGYGGSCFPKDVKALYQTAKTRGYDFKLLKAADEVNSYQKEVLLSYILKYFKGDISGKIFALWGLSFKPKTDDIREAPSLVIISKLLSYGSKVRAYDPVAMDNTRGVFPQIEYAGDMYEALRDSDGLIVATEWNDFRMPDFKKIKDNLRGGVIFDGRNIYDPKKMKEFGFNYFSIGR
ncbi:MAG: UDP-glucose/GDP-mannose dehydrogenase family protein [Deltaproteobacteria bacterium]|nr:UDP-glucose/GDP-mannose dehydrogenase family protein [Deltaproteobacteria bacterium]